jgi:hypothetical protein
MFVPSPVCSILSHALPSPLWLENISGGALFDSTWQKDLTISTGQKDFATLKDSQ